MLCQGNEMGAGGTPVWTPGAPPSTQLLFHGHVQMCSQVSVSTFPLRCQMHLGFQVHTLQAVKLSGSESGLSKFESQAFHILAGDLSHMLLNLFFWPQFPHVKENGSVNGADLLGLQERLYDIRCGSKKKKKSFSLSQAHDNIEHYSINGHCNYYYGNKIQSQAA